MFRNSPRKHNLEIRIENSNTWVVGAATETAAARNGRGGAARPATWTALHA